MATTIRSRIGISTSSIRLSRRSIVQTRYQTSQASSSTTSIPPPTPATKPKSDPYLTFPHKDLDPSLGQTRLVVRTFDYIPSILHGYAIVKAIEAKLGPVLEVDFKKDPDSLSYTSIIFITLLRPTTIPLPTIYEIPSPPTTRLPKLLGGPTLSTLQETLHHSSSIIPSSSSFSSFSSPSGSSSSSSRGLTNHPRGKDQPLQFRLEARNDVRRPFSRSGGGRGNKKSSSYLRRNQKDIEEDENLLKGLEAFQGGFYGGFEGLAERFASVLNGRVEGDLEVGRGEGKGDRRLGPRRERGGVKSSSDLEKSTSMSTSEGFSNHSSSSSDHPTPSSTLSSTASSSNPPASDSTTSTPSSPSPISNPTLEPSPQDQALRKEIEAAKSNLLRAQAAAAAIPSASEIVSESLESGIDKPAAGTTGDVKAESANPISGEREALVDDVKIRESGGEGNPKAEKKDEGIFGWFKK